MKKRMIKIRKRKVIGIPEKVGERRMGKPVTLLTIREKARDVSLIPYQAGGE
jgi:hypothetical protein